MLKEAGIVHTAISISNRSGGGGVGGGGGVVNFDVF